MGRAKKVTKPRRTIAAGDPQQRSELLSSPELWGPVSSSGEVVTPDTAMRVAAVNACVRVLSQNLAMFPLNVYRRTGEYGREIAKDHPLQRLLHQDRTNKKQDRFQFKEMMQARLCLRGNAYAFIKMNRAGDVTELIPLHPDYVMPVESGNTIVYKYYGTGKAITFAFDQVLHIRTLGDGLEGCSVIDELRDTIGSAVSMDKHGSTSFKNGATLGGILMYPKALNPKTRDTIRESWQKQYAGSSNAGKTAILEQGMEYKPIAMSNEQAQWLDAMKFKRSEIAGIFGVPPHMIGDLERATFSNIEEQSIQFIQYTMMPWLSRWEAAMDASLLTEEEQQEYCIKFNEKALLRANSLARSQKLQIERQNGIINANEWRALEDYEPLEGEEGEKYLIPMNMADASKPLPDKSDAGGQPPRTPAAKQQEPAPAESNLNRQSTKDMLMPIVLDVMNRIVRREGKQKANNENRTAWVKEFASKQGEFLSESISPLALSWSRGLKKSVEITSVVTEYLRVYEEFLHKDILEGTSPTDRANREAERLFCILEQAAA